MSLHWAFVCDTRNAIMNLLKEIKYGRRLLDEESLKPLFKNIKFVQSN